MTVPAKTNLGETEDYFVTTETIRVPQTLNKRDTVYVVVNKKTGVYEYRSGQLFEAITASLNLQNMLEGAIAKANQ